MKRKPIKLVALALLGGLLGLPAISSAKQVTQTKAEAQEVVLDMSGAKCKDAMGTSGYSSTDFTYGGISFGRKNVYVIQNGSNYKIQTKGNTSNGFWTRTTIADTYISKIEITVANAAVNLFLSSDTNFSASTSVPVGSASYTYSKTDDYHYFKVMSNGTYNTVSLKVTYTPSEGGSVDPTPVAGDFTLVKNAATLKTGDEIILGVSSKKVAAGSFSSKSLTGVPATFAEETLSSINANVLTLSKTDNGFKMLSSEGYVGTTVIKELALDTETEWAISIDSSSYKATIAAEGLGHMMYNCNSTSIFRNYSSEESDYMLLPEIYINTKTVVSNYAVTYDGNGHTGTVSDANSPYVKTSQVTVLPNSFVSITGEVFKEWNTKADGSGTSYQPNDKFSITSDIILYAIWEEEYIPVGDTFTKVTSSSALNDGDKFLFVFHNGDTVKANGSLEGGDHFAAYDAKIVSDELTYTSDKVTPLTLVKTGSEYYIELNGSYLALTANSSNKLAWKTKANANKWTISFNNGNAVVSSKISEVTHSIYYNGSGTGRFANYSSSTMSPIELWAKSGHAKEVSLSSDALDLNVGQEGTISVSECIGFTPISYAWEITSGSEFVSITAGQGTNEITLSGVAEGEAEVYVTVDGVKAKAIISVHDYQYNVLSKDAYFITAGGAMMTNEIGYLEDVDFDELNMWSFEKAYAGDNSYYLSSSKGYLSFSEDVLADGKNVSRIEITETPINVWTVSYSDGNGYKVATQTKTQGIRSLATFEETWYAFTGNNYVSLIEAGEFDHIYVKSLPTTKQYYVGEELKPLNSHVFAVYTNGFETEITNKITWDTLIEGTKAYGKVTIGGQERTVEMDGIKVFKGDASTFIVEGLQDSYPIGEKINKDFLTASITYKLAGEEDIEKVLTKNDYVISPEKVEEGTTKITVSLAKDPTVFIEKEITIKENVYVAAPHVYEGDTIVIGTLGYNPYELTGGYEVAHNGTKFTYEPFGSLPRGQMQFNVGKQDGYYTLQDVASGYYLKGDNSSLGFHMPDTKSVYAEGDGHYEFNVNVNIGGITQLVTMKTELNPDFSYTNVFTAMEYVNGYTDYITGISDLENNKLTFELYTKASDYVPVTAEINLASWSFTNGVFQYAIEASSTLPDECLFTLNYDEDFEEWVVSSKPHQDKQLYFNKDGKFGFYEIGSSYTPIMLFRNNEKPLQSNPTSLSVSFFEGMDEISVGEQFPWTSSLIVKANYSGGASKIIPVGGYQIIQMPDTSKVGKATGKISYGQIGHEIVKEFTITVKGKTQAFDVVCENPILVGETYQAHLADHYEPPVDEPITWSVSDETLASIDQNGNVTGLAPGKVDVIATSFDGTYSDFKNIEIYQQVESVTLNKHEVSLNPDETCVLSATVLPSNASNKKVKYTSSDESVATVSTDGVITAVSQGAATITCAAQNNPEENYDTCVVTVNAAPVVHVNEIRITPAELSLGVGQSSTLSVEILPNNAADKSVTWSSSNPSVATVNNGRVTGVKEGTTVITCTTNDGGLTATCEVTVTNNYVAVTSVTLNKTQAEIKVGEKVNLVATVGPENATDKTITWTSSNTSVATVNNGQVTAIKAGTAIITAKAGNVTATCEVTVKEDTPVVVHVTSLSLNKTSEEMKVGESIKLNVTVNPSDATDKGVTWSTSDESIASVTQSGVVVANKEGSVTITVTSNDGGIKATATITVKAEHVNPDPVDPVDPVEPDKPQGIIETIVDSIKNMNDKLLSLVGCKGSVAATSLIVSIASLTGTALVIARKKKDDK